MQANAAGAIQSICFQVPLPASASTEYHSHRRSLTLAVQKQSAFRFAHYPPQPHHLSHDIVLCNMICELCCKGGIQGNRRRRADRAHAQQARCRRWWRCWTAPMQACRCDNRACANVNQRTLASKGARLCSYIAIWSKQDCPACGHGTDYRKDAQHLSKNRHRGVSGKQTSSVKSTPYWAPRGKYVVESYANRRPESRNHTAQSGHDVCAAGSCRGAWRGRCTTCRLMRRPLGSSGGRAAYRRWSCCWGEGHVGL